VAQPSFKKYLSAFNSIKGLLASVGVLLPGFAYFTKYAPPLGEITLLTAAFATATILITHYYNPTQSNHPHQRLPPLIKKALIALIAAIILLALYVILLDLCTVKKSNTNNRIQIGFGKSDWSLTEYGRQVKAEDPGKTPQDWLLDESFKAGVAKRFWSAWSIYLSGTLLVAVFIFAFVSWTFGWSLIAKQKAIDGE
jgi:hypothetical protein